MFHTVLWIRRPEP